MFDARHDHKSLRNALCNEFLLINRPLSYIRHIAIFLCRFVGEVGMFVADLGQFVGCFCSDPIKELVSYDDSALPTKCFFICVATSFKEVYSRKVLSILTFTIHLPPTIIHRRRPCNINVTVFGKSLLICVISEYFYFVAEVFETGEVVGED